MVSISAPELIIASCDAANSEGYTPNPLQPASCPNNALTTGGFTGGSNVWNFKCPEGQYPMHKKTESDLFADPIADGWLIAECEEVNIHYWCCTNGCECQDPIVSSDNFGSTATAAISSVSTGTSSSDGGSENVAAVAIGSAGVIIGGVIIGVARRKALLSNSRQAQDQEKHLRMTLMTDDSIGVL